jgi:hypothetical protein
LKQQQIQILTKLITTDKKEYDIASSTNHSIELLTIYKISNKWNAKENCYSILKRIECKLSRRHFLLRFLLQIHGLLQPND